ncbi:MAG: hypothetical protein JWO57_650 [Pseudonocardiales bacterium]|nr:hypothetical protein [Pseudonocardiales bacterium]
MTGASSHQSRLVVIAAAVAALVTAAMIVWLLTRSPSTAGTGHVAASAIPSKITVSPLTAQRASELSADLATGSDAGLRAALVIPPDQKLDPAAARDLHTISPITLDVASFHATSDTIATVSGTVAHPVSGAGPRWLFTLALVSGQWKILDAAPTA